MDTPIELSNINYMGEQGKVSQRCEPSTSLCFGEASVARDRPRIYPALAGAPGPTEHTVIIDPDG